MTKTHKAEMRWDACFLKCNGVAVAEVLPERGGGDGWIARVYDSDSTYWHAEQMAAHRTINIKFGLPPDFARESTT
jgi:hypothetical protein